ncbi:MAG: response regulator [Sneathiella sp.]
MNSQRTVLVVDDRKFARIMLQKAISHYNWDWKVDVASDGEEGRTAFDENNQDIVIVDYHMPDITGLELAGELRQKNRSVPIALCIANIQNTIQKQAALLDVSFVDKPVSEISVGHFLENSEIAIWGTEQHE